MRYTDNSSAGRKPRILVINWQDWTNPASGGAEVHLREIFTRMLDDFDVFLLCSRYRGARTIEEIQGIKIFRTGNRETFNYLVPQAWKKLENRYDFDLVIEDLNKIPFFGRFFINKPRIGLVHHLFRKWIFTETNPLAGCYVYMAENLIPKFYRDIPMIVVSQSTREDLLQMGHPDDRIRVIYNGVDLSTYGCAEDKYQEPTIVCLGRMKRYKRMDIFIRSLKKVKEQVPGVRALVVGSGDDLPRLKSVARSTGMDNIIDFPGFVSEKKKKEILSKSWVAVNTSPKEGWGLTSIEAQASCTPSVVPDSPGLRETVKDGISGYIYPFNDKRKLSSILVKILQDRKRASEMGENARDWASNFTWEESSSQIRNMIKSVLRNKN